MTTIDRILNSKTHKWISKPLVQFIFVSINIILLKEVYPAPSWMICVFGALCGLISMAISGVRYATWKERKVQSKKN